MNAPTIESRFRDIFIRVMELRPDELKEDARIREDIGADSLDCAEIVMEAEEEFGIEIPDDDEVKLLTLGQAVKYLEMKIQQQEN